MRVVTSQEVYGFLNQVYPAGSPWTEEMIARDLEREDTHFWTLYKGAELAALCVVQDLAGEREILQVGVLPAYRGQGLARALLLSLPGRQPYFLEVRESNQAARGLYESLGFVEVGRRPNYYRNPVEDAILMKGELDGRENYSGI